MEVPSGGERDRPPEVQYSPGGDQTADWEAASSSVPGRGRSSSARHAARLPPPGVTLRCCAMRCAFAQSREVFRRLPACDVCQAMRVRGRHAPSLWEKGASEDRARLPKSSRLRKSPDRFCAGRENSPRLSAPLPAQTATSASAPHPGARWRSAAPPWSDGYSFRDPRRALAIVVGHVSQRAFGLWARWETCPTLVLTHHSITGAPPRRLRAGPESPTRARSVAALLTMAPRHSQNKQWVLASGDATFPPRPVRGTRVARFEKGSGHV